VDDLYTPLQRPAEPEPTHRAMAPDDSDPSAEESDSDDSDDSQHGQKKPKLKPSLMKTRQIPDKVKKYNVWSSGIQEEVLTQELTNCEVAQRYERNRDVESYDYTMSHNNTNPEEYYGNLPRTSNKRHHGECQSRGIRARLGRRRRSSDDAMKGLPRTMLDLTTTVDNTAEEVAKDIANKLCEEKEELICKYYTFHILLLDIFSMYSKTSLIVPSLINKSH
jgi:phosphorylated adapter RNA export protein